MSLYHYTSENGFKGIVINNIMRLTLSTQSNDETDTVYIYELIKRNKEKLYLKDKPEHNRIIDEVLNSFNKFEERIKSDDVNDEFAKPFVLCFTDKKDDKSMWKEYNENLGYCIGIDTEKLQQYSKTTKFQEQLNKNARSYYMTNVLYEEDKQIQAIKSIIEEEYNKFLKNNNEETCKTIEPLTFSYNIKITALGDNDEKYVYQSKPRFQTITLKQKFVDLIDLIYSQLLLVAPLIKNPYWASENEVRWTFLRMLKDKELEDIKINENDNYYFDFEIDKSIINEIIIAPLNNKSIEEVKEELKQVGYDVDKINIQYSTGKGVLRNR